MNLNFIKNDFLGFENFSKDYLSGLGADEFLEGTALLKEAISYSYFSGGKRIRPRVLCEVGRSLDLDENRLYYLGLAVEMLHTYSLIHDDLPSLDNDDYRRGKESCHKKFGEDLALLAGDALLTHSFEVLVQAFEGSDMLGKAVHSFVSHGGVNGMIGGQIDEVKLIKNSRDFSSYQSIHWKKTGGLFRLCFELPCFLKKTIDDSLFEKSSRLGLIVGESFQWSDDLEDKETYLKHFDIITHLRSLSNEGMSLAKELGFVWLIEYFEWNLNRF